MNDDLVTARELRHSLLYLEQAAILALNTLKVSRASLAGMEADLRRRLQKLEEDKAVLGISSDPSLDIEIEDIQKYFEENSE